VVEEEDQLVVITNVLGLVVLMVEHLQELMVLVVVVTAMLVAKQEDLVEVVEVVVIDLTTHRMLDLEEVVEFRFNILVVLEELMETIGEVLPIIFIMVVHQCILIVNYGTLCTIR
jgi:hypothetical protein